MPTKKTKVVLKYIIPICLLFMLNGCILPIQYDTLFGEAYSGTKGSNWTFMVYLAADNNLEGNGIDDINEMEYGLYLAQQGDALIESKLNIIVLIDRIPGYNGSNGNWANTRLYKITPDSSMNTTIISELIFNSAEQNMGDPSLLSSFVAWTKTNFPGTKYFLDIWNHGGGARSRSISSESSDFSSVKAVAWDETPDPYNPDCLYIDEVQQALAANFNSGSKLDIIGFDACIMGTVEVAYEFRNIASYMVASMANEQGDGWDYQVVFGGGTTNVATAIAADTITASNFAIRAVDAYRDSHGTYDPYAQTLAACDLAQITLLKTRIDTLAVALQSNKTTFQTYRDSLAVISFFDGDNKKSVSSPYYDLYTICEMIKTNISTISTQAQAVIDQLGLTILKAYAGSSFGNYYGTGAVVKRGLSIFISRGDLTYDNETGSGLLPHYVYQWWYTSEDTTAWWPGAHYYGKIDFCNSNANGTVETWRELFEYWYDNPNGATPSSW